VNTKNTGLGASYDMKVAKISGLYQVNKSDAVQALDTRDYLIGASAPFGVGTALVSYIFHKDKTATNADTKQIAIGYKYALSKRTTLYTSFARITNDATASIATPGIAGGTDKAFNVGMDHSF
jgi:predicted porin